MAENSYSKVDAVLNTTRDGWRPQRLSPTGETIVRDFFTDLLINGYGYQVRAGTITTPLVGDVVLTDASAEMSVDAANGTTNIITELQIAVRLHTGTLQEYAAKSVATSSTAGTAFVPLPLIVGGTAGTSIARVAAAGGVTVTAELATTTRRHWEYAHPLAAAAGSDPGILAASVLRKPVILKGGSAGTCFYVQIAATGTGPSYYAHFDYFEMATTLLTG